MKRTLLPLCISYLFNLAANAQVELSESNWRTHPAIVDIRNEYKSINDRLRSGSWKSHKRDIGSRGEYTFYKEAHVDPEFRIRLLKIHQSDEGGSYDAELYYNSLTQLRFIFIKNIIYDHTSDDPPEQMEYRLYYPTDEKSQAEPIWIVKSLNSQDVEQGAGVDIISVIEDLNIHDPYGEFHDMD